MKKTASLITVLLSLCFISPAFTQTGMGGRSFYTDFKPVVGGWSEYQVTGDAPSKMKMAVVGKEGNAYWYETVVEQKGGERVITKMLVSGDPEDRNNVKKVIVKTGNEPAMEMPVMMMGARPMKQKGEKGKVIDKGTETITVPAGTFKAQHLQYPDRNGDVDVWVQKDVSPYGMIKSKSKGHEMVLLGYGTDARTQITEKAQKLEMPEMPDMPGMPEGLKNMMPEKNR